MMMATEQCCLVSKDRLVQALRAPPLSLEPELPINERVSQPREILPQFVLFDLSIQLTVH